MGFSYNFDEKSMSLNSGIVVISSFVNVIFVDVSDTNCKKKLTTGGWHGITLTKCFADEDPRSKEIIKYLNKIY